MKTFLLVDKVTGKTKYRYTKDRKKALGAPYGDEAQYIHFEVPTGKDHNAFNLVDGSMVEDVAYVAFDTEAHELKIRSILGSKISNFEIKKQDITLLDIGQGVWNFSRGARTSREYKVDDSLVIKHSYVYVYKNGERDIESFTQKFEWFKNNEEVGLTKNKTEVFNKKQIKSINRAVRQGRIDYLESAAEDLLAASLIYPEPYKTQFLTIANSIDTIFDHYAIQIQKYIERGTMHFENDVLNESDAEIITLLDMTARQADAEFPNGLTVRQSVIHQLTGVVV